MRNNKLYNFLKYFSNGRKNGAGKIISVFIKDN